VNIPENRRCFIIAAAVGVGVVAARGYWGCSRLLDVRAQRSKLKIATIGAGRVSGSLGILFAMKGFQVLFSSEDPGQLKDLVASAGPNAKAETVGDAVAFGDVVLLVVPYTAVDQIGKDYGKQLATKQLVVDLSNPIPQCDGDDFVTKINEQGGPGVVIQKLLPDAKLVRAFNAIGYMALLTEAHRLGEPLGNDRRRRRQGSRACKLADQADRLRAGADRQPHQGQVPGAGHAVRRHAYAGGVG
jgi:8-hydroxy-5-deazaflavin:NADPH oxidoreductase